MGRVRYVGGMFNGWVQDVIYHDLDSLPPITAGPELRGKRSWYELDYVASSDFEAVYRFVGLRDPEFTALLPPDYRGVHDAG